MKKITLLLLFLTAFANAQRLDEYTASNGITYKEGDEIELNRGSGDNGRFVYVTIGGWAVSSNAYANQLPASNANINVVVKKIKKYDTKRLKAVIFTVGGGNITNYILDIENAIAACEITPCDSEDKNNASASDKYDKLAKIKKLFDEGVLSEDEYEAEKKKILESN